MEPNPPIEVRVDDSVIFHLAESPKIRTRHYLASQHLWAALISADQCKRVEQTLVGVPGIGTHPTHRGLAMGTVLSSVAFLEALVNEVYQDAAEGTGGRTEVLNVHCRALMKEYWAEGERSEILSKYQMALLFAGVQKLDLGGPPMQDAKTLVALRNALVHFRPSWHDDEAPTNLEKRLAGRFQRSPLLSPNDGSPWSIWALAAPGAGWAVDVACALAGEWSDRLGLERGYEADVAGFSSQVGSQRT